MSEMLHAVGSYIGVSADEEEIDEWKAKLDHEAEKGNIGLNLHLSKKPPSESIIKNLRRTLSVLSQSHEDIPEERLQESTKKENIPGPAKDAWDPVKDVQDEQRYKDKAKVLSHTLKQGQSVSSEFIVPQKKNQMTKSELDQDQLHKLSNDKEVQILSTSTDGMGKLTKKVGHQPVAINEDEYGLIDLTKSAYEKNVQGSSGALERLNQDRSADKVHFKSESVDSPTVSESYSTPRQKSSKKTPSIIVQESLNSLIENVAFPSGIEIFCGDESVTSFASGLSFTSVTNMESESDDYLTNRLRFSSASCLLPEDKSSKEYTTLSCSDIDGLQIVNKVEKSTSGHLTETERIIFGQHEELSKEEKPQAEQHAQSNVSFSPIVSVTEIPSKASHTLDGSEMKPGDISHGQKKVVPSKPVLKPHDEPLEEGLVYRKEGWDHYQLYVKLEHNEKARKFTKERDRIKEQLQWKFDKIEEALKIAEDHYKHGSKSKSVHKKWKELHASVSSHVAPPAGSVKSDVHVRRQLEELPLYRVWFIFAISFLQVAAVAFIIAFGNLQTIGLEPVLVYTEDIRTFIGLETVAHWKLPNMWIGTSYPYLISVGAVYAPCIREDIHLNIFYAKKGYDDGEPLGCCEIAIRNTAGTATKKQCNKLTNGVGKWTSNNTCNLRPAGSNSVLHRMKPCCYGLEGKCMLTSYAHCTALEGYYSFSGPEHCSQINCPGVICGDKVDSLPADPDHPYKPANPNQWWRFPLSLFYHYGALHVVIVSLAQIMLGYHVERLAGWFRVGIIYIVSGIGGLVLGAITMPYFPVVGADAAVFGLLGVVVVELIQSWRLVPLPWLELSKLAIVFVMLLIAGTLPTINNLAQLGGFVLGILTGCVVLPYISFSVDYKRGKTVLVAMALVITVLLYFVLFYIYYHVQGTELCSFCKYFACIPFTENLCKFDSFDED